MQLSQEYTADVSPRFSYAMIAIVIFFAIIIGRLYHLQVLEGRFYRFFSTENSIKEIKREAPRGVIFDRRGAVLVDSRPAFDIAIIPQYVVDAPKVIGSLAEFLSMPIEEIEAIWKKREGQPSYQPLMIKRDCPIDEISLIKSHMIPWYDPRSAYDFRGVEVQMRFDRTAPRGDIASHVLGYVREIDQPRLALYAQKHPGRYRLGDRIGVRGLEERFDATLRGQDGYEQLAVDATGREIVYPGIADTLEVQPARPGDNVQLTIDRELQQVARDQFGNRRGAAVVIDVYTGDVLTLFSAPSYDLNRLSGREGARYWQELSADPAKPLINRAIQGAYPPGSTYKIVTAVAGRMEKAIAPDEGIACAGALFFGGRPYHCWAKGGHGRVTLHQSLVSSCDVYYYQLGLRLGVDRIAKYARLLGLGEKTGIAVDDERSGLIPTAAWKEERFGVPWQEGETLSIAVGQGYDLVTPLQNALMVARVVNGGRPIVPRLIRTGKPVELPSPVDGLSADVLEEVKQALVGVVALPTGTAHRLSRLNATMGGKTGTAQVVELDRWRACQDESCRDHAWFVGFTPAEKPEIAAAVIVEHGGFGASAAAPIVGALFEKYWEIEKKTMEPSR